MYGDVTRHSKQKIASRETTIADSLLWNKVKRTVVATGKYYLRTIHNGRTLSIPDVPVEAYGIFFTKEAEDARHAAATAPQPITTHFAVIVEENPKLLHSIFVCIHFFSLSFTTSPYCIVDTLL